MDKKEHYFTLLLFLYFNIIKTQNYSESKKLNQYLFLKNINKKKP